MASSAQNSSGVHWCRRRVRFNQVPEKVLKVPEDVSEPFGAEPSQVQQGSGEGFGESSREGSGEGFGEGSGEGLGGFGAEPGQVQQGCGEGSGKGSRKPWCKAKSGSTGFRRTFWSHVWEVWCSQVRFNRICGHFTHGIPAEVFPAFGFAARFRKICKNKTLRLLGIPPKLILK